MSLEFKVACLDVLKPSPYTVAIVTVTSWSATVTPLTVSNAISAMHMINRSRDNLGSNAYPEEQREEILRAHEERSSLRGLQRTFGVSRNTVTTWIKKRGSATSVS